MYATRLSFREPRVIRPASHAKQIGSAYNEQAVAALVSGWLGLTDTLHVVGWAKPSQMHGCVSKRRRRRRVHTHVANAPRPQESAQVREVLATTDTQRWASRARHAGLPRAFRCTPSARAQRWPVIAALRLSGAAHLSCIGWKLESAAALHTARANAPLLRYAGDPFHWRRRNKARSYNFRRGRFMRGCKKATGKVRLKYRFSRCAGLLNTYRCTPQNAFLFWKSYPKDRESECAC